MKAKDGGGKADAIPKSRWATFWSLYYVHRYLRLTGALLFVSLFNATVLQYLEAGFAEWMFKAQVSVCSSVLKHVVKVAFPQREVCERDWVWNILYVFNWVGDGECVGQVWYLSTEFQVCFSWIF